MRGYGRSLEWVLRHQTLTLLVTAVTLAATVWLYFVVPKGFLPLQDTGLITAVTEAGTEVSFAEMQRLQKLVADKIRQDPDVTGVVSVVGVSPLNATPNAGRLTITLHPRGDRKAAVSEIIERMQHAIADIAGMTVFFQPVQDIQISTRASRAQYQYTLVATDAAEVALWSDRLVDALRDNATLRDVSSEAQEGGLRVMINVDREKAGRLGISMQVINDTLNDAFGQRQISTIYGQANQYRVILEAAPQYQRDPSALSKIYIPANIPSQPLQSSSAQNIQPLSSFTPGANSTQVPLSAFAEMIRTTAPLAIAHQEQFPSVTLSFNLAHGAALGDAVRIISSAERVIGMPASVIGSYSGDTAEFAKSLENEPWLILAAVVTIYIVLGVLYESFIHPLTILSTLAVGRRRRAARADAGRARPLRHCADRHRAADGHREEERHHDDRLRARSRAAPRPVAARRDRAGLAAALPPDHDDDAGGAVRRAAARARKRHRLGAALPARRHHHRRAAAEPVAHPLHHAGDLPRARTAARAPHARHAAASGAAGGGVRR